MSNTSGSVFPIGSTFQSETRTLSEGECAILTSLTWTTGAIHSDRPYALTTEFGELILAGAVIVALAAGLLSSTEIYRDLEHKYGVRTVAALDANASFKAPVRFGDSIHLDVTLTEVRASSSRPNCHVLAFSDRVVRQDGVVAVLLDRHILVEAIST